MSMIQTISKDGTTKTTYDEFNERCRTVEIKCHRCKEWYEEGEIIWSNDKPYCEDCIEDYDYSSY